jgi:hypothetical protein
VRLLSLLWLALWLTGCASVPQPFSKHFEKEASPAVRECASLIRSVDEAVAKAGVSDGGEARIAGYPYLRATRFLASLKDKVSESSAFEQWMHMLRETDLTARSYEIQNLPSAAVNGADREDTLKRLSACGEQLAKLDTAVDSQREGLKRKVIVPPDYQTWKRVLGVYALTRIPFAAGVRGYQRETEEKFHLPLEELEVKGQLVNYGPAPAQVRIEGQEQPATFEMSDNALQLPGPSREALSNLFERHAPLFEVDEAGDFDRIGAPVWSANEHLSIDTTKPTVYRRVSHTRLQGRTLLQLNYGIWFPARPKTGAFDLLGGKFDGVLWRVTLDEGGRPLLFDSIHQCGCYHQFFPTSDAKLKPKPNSLDEYAFVPQALPRIHDGQRVSLRIASRTHYLERIRVVTGIQGTDKEYAFAEDDELRSLPLPNGLRRSVFRPNGIVAGSERGERFLFWPMGVPNAGAMRQFGRHATAFVGRRHFDDPDLLERYFDMEGTKQP